MSRAFVSEEAEENRSSRPAERPISSHPNLVTPNGLVRIDTEVASLQSMLAASPADDLRPRLLRDLRYWQARRATAKLVETRDTVPQEVVFGVMVSIRRGGTVSRFRIVGEDEADPAHGLLSYTAPLATAVLGARPGETVELDGGREPVLVTAIET